MEAEIANRIGRAWACFPRNGEAVYDRWELPVELKARLAKAEVLETLLYVCETWNPSAANYTALNGAHRKFLTRVIGWRKGKRTDRPLSYAEALTRAGCAETIETTVRKRSLLFAGCITCIGAERLLKTVLLGEAVRGKRSQGGQEHDWVRRLGDDLLAFNLGDEKEGEKWKTSGEDLEEGYTKIEGGAEWLLRRWHRAQAEESGERQKKRGAVMEDST